MLECHSVFSLKIKIISIIILYLRFSVFTIHTSLRIVNKLFTMYVLRFCCSVYYFHFTDIYHTISSETSVSAIKKISFTFQINNIHTI